MSRKENVSRDVFEKEVTNMHENNISRKGELKNEKF